MEIESGDTFEADAKIGSFTLSHVFLPIQRINYTLKDDRNHCR